MPCQWKLITCSTTHKGVVDVKHKVESIDVKAEDLDGQVQIGSRRVAKAEKLNLTKFTFLLDVIFSCGCGGLLHQPQ